jgi:hypothetical protein
VHASLVEAQPGIAWPAIRRGDLSRSRVIRLLLELRSLPSRLSGAAQSPPPLTPDDMTRAGWLLLHEQPGREVVFGWVGRAWKVSDGGDRLPAIEPAGFAAFDRPGFTKVAFSIRVQPHGTGRSLVLTETQTAATHPGSRRRFRPYWRVIVPSAA